MAEHIHTAIRMRISWGGKIAAGIFAGILAAVLMIAVMMVGSGAVGMGATMPLKALAAFVFGVEALIEGSRAVAAGVGLQLAFSVFLGILFGLATSLRTSTVLELLVGIVVGIAVWVAMDVYVLPFMNPTMAARVELMPIAYFVAHLLFGIGLGLTSLFTRALSGRDRRTRPVEPPAEPLPT